MKAASAVKSSIVFDSVENLPDGKLCGIVRIVSFDDVQALPKVVAFEGVTMARTGWNSDSMVAYYKSGQMIATAAR